MDSEGRGEMLPFTFYLSALLGFVSLHLDYFCFFFLKIKNSLSNSGINHLPFLQGSLPHFMHVIDGYKELYAKGRALERKSVLVFLGQACGSAEG